MLSVKKNNDAIVWASNLLLHFFFFFFLYLALSWTKNRKKHTHRCQVVKHKGAKKNDWKWTKTFVSLLKTEDSSYINCIYPQGGGGELSKTHCDELLTSHNQNTENVFAKFEIRWFIFKENLLGKHRYVFLTKQSILHAEKEREKKKMFWRH